MRVGRGRGRRKPCRRVRRHIRASATAKPSTPTAIQSATATTTTTTTTTTASATTSAATTTKPATVRRSEAGALDECIVTRKPSHDKFRVRLETNQRGVHYKRYNDVNQGTGQRKLRVPGAIAAKPSPSANGVRKQRISVHHVNGHPHNAVDDEQQASKQSCGRWGYPQVLRVR